MHVRVSQLQNQEVDYVRFDRIKIQRKRMEHILEVIKDLTFKNRQLIKQNIQLKQELDQERQTKGQYEELYAQRKILVQKNVMLSNELSRYRQTALSQEVLISTLKEELSCVGVQRDRFVRDHYYTEPHLTLTPNISQNVQERSIFSEEFQILKAQYDDLQDEYSKLFKRQYSKQKENHDLTGHIYTGNKQKSKKYILNRVKSQKELENEVDYSKLRNKYDKLKKIKKELIKHMKGLQCKIECFQTREQTLLELVQLLKDKRTKICRCHINKIQKQLQLKSTLIQNNVSDCLN